MIPVEESQSQPGLPQTIVIMGVSGCGKSLIGGLLAESLGAVFDDGDDFHPPRNKAKMADGIPLTDEDRWPWYEALRRRIEEVRQTGRSHVLACSALKAAYRDRLSGDHAQEAGGPDKKVRFVLLRGSRELIRQRLAGRRGHFMPAALLDSQLDTLEETPDLITVSIDQTPAMIVQEIVLRLQPAGTGHS